MARALIRAGYDYVGRYTLTLDGVAEDLSAATLIEASLVNATKTAELIVDTAQLNSGGANWSLGIVVIAFPASLTVGLAAQDAWIELAVVLAGVRLPYRSIPALVELGWTL